jgi:hypothetical protein
MIWVMDILTPKAPELTFFLSGPSFEAEADGVGGPCRRWADDSNYVWRCHEIIPLTLQQ